MSKKLNENLSILAAQGSDFENGFSAARVAGISNAKILHFTRTMEAVRSGRLHPVKLFDKLKEGGVGGPSDYPLLFADAIDRQLLGGYAEAPASYPAYAMRKVNNQLDVAAKLFSIDGGEGVNEEIGDLAPYPESSTTESKYDITVKKYGGKFAYGLKLMLNDDLGAFQNTPTRMGKRVRRTEETIVTKAFATDAAKAAMFTNGNLNKVNQACGASADNPALGVSGVLDALKVLSRQVDTDGQPIVIQGAVVVYPAELDAVVLQIRHALELRSITRAGDSSNTVVSSNYLAGMLEWVPNYQLSIVAETNPHTGWFMFANPNNQRPALAYAVLRGREQPELFMKASNSVAIGGADAGPMSGSFENDSIEYKVRQYFGAARVDPKMAVFSEGDGN